ncbi:cytochrome-c oxidase, cbb3-type subunit III [Gammaproteobacteria bacterium 45_16_T64]|nr:cytochrome-c oxidase, cbb3-type subunit III [Gammaproteobacteria bacterium 45_16_T64]
MNEMSSFWSGWITFIALLNIFLCVWMLWWCQRKHDDDVPEGESMGHSFDGIEEFNNPLPRWWLGMFYAGIVFALLYLMLYPGLGAYKGALGWTAVNQWEREIQKADNRYDRIFEDYAKVSIEDLSKDPEAVKVGQRLFGNNCALCHGSDAHGAPGFPNLTDTDWLYGGDPETIKKTITFGRNGNMPTMAAAVGDTADIKNVAAHVLSLSGRKGSGDAEAGRAKFALCAACHGQDAKGNKMLGAPNLTDNVWLHGGDEASIIETITNGRSGAMPTFKDKLSEEKIHVLAAYVYSLNK